jgi:large subunit ribosomal protein L13
MYICTLRFGKTLIYMGKLSYKTISANRKTVTKEWALIDASDISLGRTASVVAGLLRGKHKSNFTPHVDCGDNVVVINADKIKLTGDKWSQKKYISHSGYPGGQKIITADKLHKKNNIKLVENAVKGMLPKNKLGAELFRNLKVFPQTDHNYKAQKPKLIDLNAKI